jgi:predicted nucleotidyltransferase
MNIHINEEEFNELKKYTVGEYQFGSVLYGLNNEKSDTDILYLYENPIHWDETLKFYNINHQFQYKEVNKNIDHLFTSVEQFWKNLSNGDSTINCDIFLFNKDFNNAINSDYRLKFVRTYRIMKAYLGLAKRDFKKANEGNHKLIHGARCLYMVETLINNELPTINGIQEYVKNISTKDLSNLIDNEIQLRKKLTDMLENKEITHYYIPNINDNLLYKLMQSINTIEFKYD